MIRLLTYIILATLVSCSGTNVLTYKNRLYFHEKSTITNDSISKFYQLVCYDKPNVLDEEFCYDLTLIFPDTIVIKAKKSLNFSIDTAIIKSKYVLSSVWNWSSENNKVAGRIKILNWNRNEVKLKETIIVFDFRRKQIKKFVGTRVFKRTL